MEQICPHCSRSDLGRYGQIWRQTCPDLPPMVLALIRADLGRCSYARSVRGRSAQILDPIWGRSVHNHQ
eukprot:gene16852-biopygen17291